MNQPPDPILKFFLQKMKGYMNDPSSKLYLPKLIQNQTDPRYEPYTLHGAWQLPDSAVLTKVTEAICIGTMSKTCLDSAATASPNLRLSDPGGMPFADPWPFRIAGLSNLTIGDIRMDGGETFTASAFVGGIAELPFLTVSGNFVLSQSCRCVDDGDRWTAMGYGTFSYGIKAVTATLTATAYVATSGPNANYLAVRVDKLGVTADTASDKLVVSVSVKTFSGADEEMWGSTIHDVLVSKTMADTIVRKVSEKLDEPGTRRDFETQLDVVLLQVQKEFAARRRA